MTDGSKTTRPWQEIAAEAAREKDSEKLIKLTQELEQALEERGKKLRSRSEEQVRRKSAHSC